MIYVKEIIKSEKYIKIDKTTIIICNIRTIMEYDSTRFYLHIDGKSFGFDTKEERDGLYNHIIDNI